MRQGGQGASYGGHASAFVNFGWRAKLRASKTNAVLHFCLSNIVGLDCGVVCFDCDENLRMLPHYTEKEREDQNLGLWETTDTQSLPHLVLK